MKKFFFFELSRIRKHEICARSSALEGEMLPGAHGIKAAQQDADFMPSDHFSCKLRVYFLRTGKPGIGGRAYALQ